MIVQNKKALHDYFIEETYEAGIALLGWEVKSLRAARVNLTDSYIIVKNHELWLIGTNITPLSTVSTHIVPDPIRTRKLLLNKTEIKKLIGNVERKGYTLVPLKLYWKNNHIKLALGLAKGKKQFDKRAVLKEKESQREAARILKRKNAIK